MYLGHLKVYRTALARAVGGMRDGFEGSADYDLALRMAERTAASATFRGSSTTGAPLRSSMADTATNKPQSFESGRSAVAEALERRRIDATASSPTSRGGRPSARTVRFPAPRGARSPSSSPRGQGWSCCATASTASRRKHPAPAYELLIIDNESRDPATREYLARSPHRVRALRQRRHFQLRGHGERGLREADTDYFVLLNNDTLVIAPDGWTSCSATARCPGWAR